MQTLVKRLVSAWRTRTRFGGPSLAASQRRVRHLGSIGLTVAGLLALNPFLGEHLALESYDTLQRLRPAGWLTPPREVVVIRLDDVSREELGQRRAYVWDRQLHTRLLDQLRLAGSRTVAMDLFFGDEANGDADFARAIGQHGQVVLGMNLTEDTVGGALDTQHPEPPISLLATNAAQIGLLTVVEGPDGIVRRLLRGRRLRDDRWMPALSLAAAEVEWRLGRATRHLLPDDLWLNYYGPPGETLTEMSYLEALQPEARERLKDKLVVLGSQFALDFPGAPKDTFPSPWGSNRRKIAGVELHATALLNLLRGEWLRRAPPLAEWFTVMAFGLLLGRMLPRLRPAIAVAAGMAIAGAVFAGSLTLGWMAHWWWPWLVVVAVQVPLGVAWAWGANLLLLGHEKDLLRHSLTTYLSPHLVEEIVARPESLRRGGEHRQVVILFTDITDFSKIAEHTDPQELVGLLNDYYETAIQCVHETDGTVLGILGDGLLAVWNAPIDQTFPERRALKSAFSLGQRLRKFEGRPRILPLRTRVGLHCGVACVGNFGSPEHFAYTAIGDAVNLASRLEGLNKFLGTEILASRAFHDALGTPGLGRSLGAFRFKGFDQALEVFEMRDDAVHGPWVAEFEQGLQYFIQANFVAAARSFEAALVVAPGDGAARFYAARAQELAIRPPGFTGTPIIELGDK